MTRPVVTDDEAIARALQEQYSREFRSHQARSQRSAQPSSVIVRGRPVTSGVSSRGDIIAGQTRGTGPARESRSVTRSQGPLPHDQPRSSSRQRSHSRPREHSNDIRSSSLQPPSRAPSSRSTASNIQTHRSNYYGSQRSLPAERSRSPTRSNRLSVHQFDAPPSHTRNPPSPTNGQYIENNDFDDAEYARRLQAEILEEEAVLRASSSRNVTRSDPRKDATPLTSRTSSEVSNLSLKDGSDEHTAMRIQQEVYDEELARRLAKAEQERVSANRARQFASTPPPPKRCTVSRCLSYLIPLIFVLAAIAGVVYYFLRPSDFPKIFPSPEDFRNEDPFHAVNPSQADKWRSDGKGKGLSLSVVNALDSRWYPYFDLAISQWDNGDPDALTLTTSTIDPDSSCDAIDGKLKVCNGDYGDTKWLGINKVLLSNGYIFASAARMNEYYLEGSSDDQKQYTMCHEVGHGFGLPHSDESFTNKDLGNCMDYTEHPEVNKQPDVSNYNFLAQLYGTVGGSNSNVNSTASALGTSTSNAIVSGGNRVLENQIPDWVHAKWHLLEAELDNHSHGSESLNGWRLLHCSNGLEAHELDIGDGFAIQVHKVLVVQ